MTPSSAALVLKSKPAEVRAVGSHTGHVLVGSLLLNSNWTNLRGSRLAREPTRIMAALLANLAEDDWSWTPAQTGRIRSGTASIRSRGRLKLREGAVWVDPTYRQQHEPLLSSLALTEYRRLARERVLAVLLSHSSSRTAAEILAPMPMDSRVAEAGNLASVRSALTNLKRNGAIASPSKRGNYEAANDGAE